MKLVERWPVVAVLVAVLGASCSAPAAEVADESGAPSASLVVDPFPSIGQTRSNDPRQVPAPAHSWAFPLDDEWFGGTLDGKATNLGLDAPNEATALGPNIILSTQFGAEPARVDRFDPTTRVTSELLRIDGARYLQAIESPNGTVFAHWVTSDDAGIMMLAAGGITKTLVAGGPITSNMSRVGLSVSPDGSMVGSALCDAGTCTVDLVDVNAGTHFRLATGFTLLAVGDRTAVVIDPESRMVLLDSVTRSEVILPISRSDITGGFPGGPQIDAVVALEGDRFLVQRTSKGKVDMVLLTGGSPDEVLVRREEHVTESPDLILIAKLSPLGDLVWLSDDKEPTPGSPLWTLDVRDGTVQSAGPIPDVDR